MAEPHAHSQPIETYGLAPRPQPTNRNIWRSAAQQKHMAEPHAHSQPIETYGRAPHNRLRNAWPILLSVPAPVLIPLLSGFGRTAFIVKASDLKPLYSHNYCQNKQMARTLLLDLVDVLIFLLNWTIFLNGQQVIICD